MEVRAWAAATLALCSMSAATFGDARAQWGQFPNLFSKQQPRVAQRAGSVAYYQQDAAASQDANVRPAVPSMQAESSLQPMMGGPTPGYYEPQMTHPSQGQVIENHAMDGSMYTDGCESGACSDSYGMYDSGCCDTCGGYGSSCSCFCPPGWSLFGFGGLPGRFYVTADYVYARASFSEAVAFIIHDPDQAPEFFDEFHELDFQYESSFRVGGGYFIDCCDEQIRFMFTRLTSFAEAFTDDANAVGAFETSPGPGGTLDVSADVDVASYDLEYAKTFRFGGATCDCECADPCGCEGGVGCGCGGCTPSCPEWAITWSGGFRFADVDWQRSYISSNPQVPVDRDALTTLDFRGGGPRFGLEGRRYFGPDGCASIFLRGDISLLLGDVDLFEQRISDDPIQTTPPTVQTQTASFRNIIPVTEIETGLSAYMTRNVILSTGYLFSAWHDLGFRDQFAFATFLETNYDDANILGFDGFFARLEASY
jgi:hypothetical protein